MTVWFTADSHFSHRNIIKYCNRPFSSVAEMDETMIANWNDRVSQHDTVYHLGDFMFGKNQLRILQRLNGRKHLILGNHDRDVSLADGWIWINHYAEVTCSKQHIVLFHYAMKVWNRSYYGSWHLFGHSHGTLPDDSNSLSFDVGVDCHDFKPLSFEEVKQMMRPKVAVFEETKS